VSRLVLDQSSIELISSEPPIVTLVPKCEARAEGRARCPHRAVSVLFEHLETRRRDRDIAPYLRQSAVQSLVPASPALGQSEPYLAKNSDRAHSRSEFRFDADEQTEPVAVERLPDGKLAVALARIELGQRRAIIMTDPAAREFT